MSLPHLLAAKGLNRARASSLPHPSVQVQNISQSMEVLDLRTYRDLQYVRNTEALMKGLDSRLKVAAESQKSLNAKSFQVSLSHSNAS